MKPKYHYKIESANVDPSSFVQRKSLGGYQKRGELALEIAAQRATEVVILTTNGEKIGEKTSRGYAYGAAYYAWQALEIATQFYRLASETSDDRNFISGVDALFDFGPVYFNAIVESSYAPEWTRNSSPAFRYSDAIKKGDRSATEQASRDVAGIVSKFCQIALAVAPKNKEILKTFDVAQSVEKGWNRAPRAERSLLDYCDPFHFIGG